MRIYKNQFFKTKDEAKAFQKEKGYGALYSNVKGSKTKRDYTAELAILSPNDPLKFAQEYPYVVAWTQVM